MKREDRDGGDGYHHGDLKEALVLAATEILEAGGEGALTLREVARRIGVSHAAPYHHFRDKAQLLDAVAAEGFRRMRVAMLAAARGADALAGLQAYGLAYAGFAQEHPALFRLMFTRTARIEPRTSGEPTVEGVMLDGIRQAAGCDAPKAERILLLLWSSLHGVTMLWLDGQFQGAELRVKVLELTGMLGAVLRG